LARGTKRNFQVLSPLEFLAEFTQHIPAKGAHLIRYYGWYSNKARGIRRKAAEAAAAAAAQADATPPATLAPSPSATWAMLIKRVFEVNPLACPQCGGEMKVIAFIEPPQGEVIEKILRHCGLWQPAKPRPPPANVADPASEEAIADDSGELTYVDMDTFWATF
jgi:hypothetical protein